MAHGDNVLARLQKATGNPAATILLYRLLFWHKSGKGRQMEGQKWVPNSISDWMKETGLTFQQVRTALKVIEDAHLAEMKVAVYATRPTLHSRPTQRAEAIAEGSFDEVEDLPACSEQQEPLLPATSDAVVGNTGPCHQQHAIQGDTKQGDKQEDTGEPCSSLEPDGQSEKTSEGEAHVNMAEALKAGKAKTSAMIHKPDTPKKLAHMWKEHVAQDTGALINLSGKALGQLKHFIGLCPPGKAEKVLTEVLSDWTGFTTQVKSQADAKTAPSAPNVDFLLKHASIAVIFATPVQLISQSTKPTVQEAQKAEPVSVKLTVQLISAEDETPATYEELLALSKGL